MNILDIIWAKWLKWRITKIKVVEQRLQKELREIREKCSHSKLPSRNINEEYMDTCPDCGFVSYRYCI